MAQVDFSNMLDVKVNEVKRPPPKPPGIYSGVIDSYKFDKSSKKGTPCIVLTLSSMTPGEDVDKDALVDAEGAPLDITNWKPQTSMYYTPDSLYRITEFLQGFKGIQTEGRSIREVLPEIVGQPVNVTVTLKATEDGDGFFNQVEKPVAAE